jgi:UPF0271 protein
MRTVDLNIDLGELADEPDELYALATVVNIACGGHAGDADSMRRALDLAKKSGAVVAAHPSYPDRAGFGRGTMALPARELYESVVEQCDQLAHLARAAGTVVEKAKLHGALYHDAARDPLVAAPALDAIVAVFPDGPAIVGPARGAMREAAEARGLVYQVEGFADRRSLPDGTLVPRTEPDALLEDPAMCAAQALRLASTGAADTVCVHGDTKGAVAIARAVRQALADASLLRAR